MNQKQDKNKYARKHLWQTSSVAKHSQAGFTLMEIVVATTIFATTLTLMFSMLNYMLKLNRRGEALRQATQGMRNFTEFLTKEIRNGKIDYASGLSGCPSGSYSAVTSYLALINIKGEQECLLWNPNDPTGAITIEKQGTGAHALNPVNFKVLHAKFFIRPTSDPYAGTPPPRLQPSVTIAITFEVQLSAGEPAITIPYQTTVSSDLYDIPQ